MLLTLVPRTKMRTFMKVTTCEVTAMRVVVRLGIVVLYILFTAMFFYSAVMVLWDALAGNLAALYLSGADCVLSIVGAVLCIVLYFHVRFRQDDQDERVNCSLNSVPSLPQEV
jgi:hypothetical protein